MRFRELLDLLHESLDQGELAYAALFTSFPPEQIANMAEKELQGLVAQEIVGDPTRLHHALLDMRFTMRNFERDFEQVYNNVVSE